MTHAQSWAVADAALDRVLSEMVTPIASIPPAERQGFYRGWERIARTPYSTVGGIYNRQKLAARAMSIADHVWPLYPPQAEES